MVNATLRPLYPQEFSGIYRAGGWICPRTGMDRREKPRPPTGIRSPDRPARSQSLYRPQGKMRRSFAMLENINMSYMLCDNTCQFIKKASQKQAPLSCISTTLRSGRQQHRYCWELVSIVYNSAAWNAYGIYD